MEDHQWVNRTAVQDIVVSFDVTQIIYQDGTQEDSNSPIAFRSNLG